MRHSRSTARPTPGTTCSRTTSRYAARTSATRWRAPTRAARRTSRSASRATAATCSRTSRRKISERGFLASANQHFAIALDNQLVSVPQVDYKQFQDGIPSSGGSEITGGFTPPPHRRWQRSCGWARCRSSSCRSPKARSRQRWDQQALHQGLVAGLVGLGVVALLLLTYYRVLGLIAVGGLVVYGIYFYGLIKLIPITMSLAGIAGLILTIGVAADANVVIFERVKEEIRAGRTIRQGIITGYRKGITAIIDANVVTIMTAFILFVLSTSDVKGFAFTLGIGTFVSLFTAVLATQAILTTMGDSRAIQSPSALGAGGAKRHWRFDFMGASRYFFSMSGVILLVGALAIGGRGLNLGIDFTGGTQMQVGFLHRATVSEVKSLVQGVGGGGNATVQAVSGKSLGPYGFQISSKYLGRSTTRTCVANSRANTGFGTATSTRPASVRRSAPPSRTARSWRSSSRCS